MSQKRVLFLRTTIINFPISRSFFPNSPAYENILVAILFIIAANIKYDGDIFFILGENNLFQRSVGKMHILLHKKQNDSLQTHTKKVRQKS